jgi:hypothetical protein
MGQARLVDICERGLAVELPEKPQPNTYIRFQCDKMNVYGTGAVRHCQSNGARFIVGVEFSAGLRWQPPRPMANAQTLDVSRPSDKFEWNWLFDKPADAVMGLSACGND